MSDYNVINVFDSEYNDNDNDNDNYSEYTVTDGEYDDIVYETDEDCNTRFSIALCELYNEKIQGYTSSYVKYHYLVNTRFKQLDMICINEFVDFLNNSYINEVDLNHNIFKNYRNMILNGNYIKPEIVEVLSLKGDEGLGDYYVAIKKTFWIKIIQRTWKNIIKKRKEIITNRKKLISLFYREINGRWTNNCLQYPGLRGMLSNLKI